MNDALESGYALMGFSEYFFRTFNGWENVGAWKIRQPGAEGNEVVAANRAPDLTGLCG